MIMLGLGIVFQIPTLAFLLGRIGLVTPRMMLKVWRHAIVLIAIIAMEKFLQLGPPLAVMMAACGIIVAAGFRLAGKHPGRSTSRVHRPAPCFIDDRNAMTTRHLPRLLGAAVLSAGAVLGQEDRRQHPASLAQRANRQPDSRRRHDGPGQSAAQEEGREAQEYRHH